jgi:hypothetical protein
MKLNLPTKSLFFIALVLCMLGIGVYAGRTMKKPAQPEHAALQNAADDETELKRLAVSVAEGWKIPDLQYEVTVPNRVGTYARAVVTPTNQTLDPLQIIFEKIDGKWTYIDMGSTFPELEAQMPDLFRE